MRRRRVIVVGSGLAGLGAAASLARAGHEVSVLERTGQVGGLSGSFTKDGYTYSIGPHFLESSLADKVPGLRDECFETEYLEEICVGGRLLRFPVGLLRRPRMVAGVGLATAAKLARRRPRTLAEHLAYHYGPGFGGGVLRPLLEKWAGRPAEEVSMDLAKRLDPPSLAVFLHHVRVFFTRRSRHLDPGRGVWMYPKQGTQAISAHVVRSHALDVHTSSPVDAIATDDTQLLGVKSAGRELEADAVVYTGSVAQLHRLATGTHVFDAASALRFRPVILVFVRIARARVTRYQWVWFPEPRFCFYRVSESKNIHPSFAPADSTLLTFEVACDTSDPTWTASDDELGRRCYDELASVYDLPADAYLGAETVRVPGVYPIFLVATEATHRAIGHQTAVRGLFLAGRFGLFRYLMMEESYDSGVACGGLVSRFLDGS